MLSQQKDINPITERHQSPGSRVDGSKVSAYLSVLVGIDWWLFPITGQSHPHSAAQGIISCQYHLYSHAARAKKKWHNAVVCFDEKAVGMADRLSVRTRNKRLAPSPSRIPLSAYNLTKGSCNTHHQLYGLLFCRSEGINPFIAEISFSISPPQCGPRPDSSSISGSSGRCIRLAIGLLTLQHSLMGLVVAIDRYNERMSQLEPLQATRGGPLLPLPSGSAAAALPTHVSPTTCHDLLLGSVSNARFICGVFGFCTLCCGPRPCVPIISIPEQC